MGSNKTTRSLLSKFLSLAKRHHYSWDDIHVGLIVSTGRTGTKAIANVLSRILDHVDSRHEPIPDLFDLSMNYIRSKKPMSDTLQNLKRQRSVICREVHLKGYDYYIEANNNLSYIIPIAKACFKKCKIIHIVRDGRDFVRSSYSKTVRHRDGRKNKAYFMDSTDPRRRLQAIDFPNDEYASRWNGMSRFERICWYWCKKDGIICDSIRGDQDAITLKFEDIFSKDIGYAGMWDLIDFLELRDHINCKTLDLSNVMSSKQNRTDHYLIPHWSQWSSDLSQQFNNIAAKHMATHGYVL